MKKQVMKRAWEIKKEADNRTRNQLLNHNIHRELEESEKAIFAVCLKMAWEEVKKASEIAQRYDVTIENALVMAEKETELNREGTVTWRIWKNYGKYRAYYTVSGRSKYANNKKDNFVELAA